mgnify:CR=1 FL=1
MEQIAEIAGTLIGIAYLYWEYKADDKVWLAGMLMPAISLVVLGPWYNCSITASLSPAGIPPKSL